MEIAARINRTKYDAFRWRYELSIPKKLTLALGIACLTGLMAQVRFPNPWMPAIPITGQTFAVLLAAGLGFMGLPWFSGRQSGLGATGGYIIGLSRLLFSWVTLSISTSGREAF